MPFLSSMKYVSYVLLLLVLVNCGSGQDLTSAQITQSTTPTDEPIASRVAAAVTATVRTETPASAATEVPSPTVAEPTVSLTAAQPTPQMDIDPKLVGTIAIDGSSTVFPITEYIAQKFHQHAPDVTIQLGVSGTSGGFKAFCAGDTVVSDASRPIKESEAATCAENEIEFIEVPIAYDGISVVVHPDNSWATCMTIEELQTMWQPGAEESITTWQDIRANWPDIPLTLYGAGSDSGTFDYFTAAIVGEEGASRSDYTGSEDDYLIAQDIAADEGAIGYFGYAYYREYQDRLQLVAIDNGDGCVEPSQASITDGTYQPLARPIFIYINKAALADPALATFVDYYMATVVEAVAAVRYVTLPERAYRLGERRIENQRSGTMFSSDVPIGVSIEQLLELEDQE